MSSRAAASDAGSSTSTRDDALRRAEPAQQRGGRVGPDVADRDLVIGALDEVGDGGRPHLARPAEDQDAAHAVALLERIRPAPAPGAVHVPAELLGVVSSVSAVSSAYSS